MKVLGIIPASKADLRVVGGKPLMVWTIEAALKSTEITRLLVATDDDEVSDVAWAHKCASLLTNNGKTYEAMLPGYDKIIVMEPREADAFQAHSAA